MSSKCVLIVEDDPKSLYALKAVLERQGFSALGFDSPRAAQAIDASSIHAAIVDLRLPEIPGVEFARTLRQVNPELRLVFVTAHSAAEFPPKLSDAPLLIKPLDIEHLLKLLS